MHNKFKCDVNNVLVPLCSVPMNLKANDRVWVKWQQFIQQRKLHLLIFLRWCRIPKTLVCYSLHLWGRAIYNIFLNSNFPDKSALKWSLELTLKDPGEGGNPPIGQEIACHFSQDHAMVTKILDIIHKHPKYQLVKSFFYYLDRFSRNLAKTDKTSWFFGIENQEINFFSIFSVKKSIWFYFNSEWHKHWVLNSLHEGRWRLQLE